MYQNTTSWFLNKVIKYVVENTLPRFSLQNLTQHKTPFQCRIQYYRILL